MEQKKQKFKSKLFKNLEHGDYKKIAKATGFHYNTVRNTLLYGAENDTIRRAAQKLSEFNQSLKDI